MTKHLWQSREELVQGNQFRLGDLGSQLLTVKPTFKALHTNHVLSVPRPL